MPIVVAVQSKAIAGIAVKAWRFVCCCCFVSGLCNGILIFHRNPHGCLCLISCDIETSKILWSEQLYSALISHSFTAAIMLLFVMVMSMFELEVFHPEVFVK